MALEPLRIIKQWFTNSPNIEKCWDEIADKVSAFALRTNNNLKQLAQDLGGADYDFNNNGQKTQATSILTRIEAVEGTQAILGTRNIGLDLSSTNIVRIVQSEGSELTSLDPGSVTFNDASNPGELVTRTIAAPLSLTLTGCHWGFDTLGDLTDKKLWIVLIDTGSSVILGVDATGGRQTVSPADAETVASSVNSIEKVYVTSEPGGIYNCVYLGWINADFDDTGNGGGENYWTLQTAVGDINIGRGEDERRNSVVEGNQTVAGNQTVTGNQTIAGNLTVGGNTTLGNAATDTITPTGTFNTAFALGAKSPGWLSNLGISLSAGVLSLVDAAGTALSATNYGWVTVPSTTAGRFSTLKITAGGSFQDVVGSSDLTNLEFGISTGANWAQDMPFFLYVANRANSNIDGVDGSSVFFLSRNPSLTATPSSVNDIGDTGAISANDSQNVILILQDVTIANYTSLPCQLIGALRMRYATATHDWTIQTLGNNDGLGREQLDKTFATVWTMPAGQNGASGSVYLIDNGGTAPTFTTNYYSYIISREGWCSVIINLNGDGGTDGAGAVTAKIALPYVTQNTTVTEFTGPGLVNAAGFVQQVWLGEIDASTSLLTIFLATTLAFAQNGNFSNGTRQIGTNCRYKAF